MKKKIIIAISVVVLLFIGLIIRVRIANAPTKKIIIFEKPENYKEIIDNSVDPNTIKELTNSNNKSQNVEAANAPISVIIGTWTGEMSGKKLTLVIEKINGTDLIGYNILGSNKRELKGMFTNGSVDLPCSTVYDATLNEPGDDKWDGIFTVKFIGFEDTNETNECIGNLKGQEAQGEWKSNNGKSIKSFTLTKEH